jgi:hypothetical protein
MSLISGVFVSSATFSLVLACASAIDCPERPNPIINISLSEHRYVSMTVKNAHARPICIGESDWPTPTHVNANPFIVKGTSGNEWTFTGFYFSPSPNVKRIGPGEEDHTGQIDLFSVYKSDRPDDEIVSVTWRMRFWFCECPSRNET